jgi:hypothetical protein
MEEMISEKKDLAEGSSSCSNSRVYVRHCRQGKSMVLTLGMLVAQSALSHVCKLDCAF